MRSRVELRCSIARARGWSNVLAALEKGGGGDAVMIGDSTWDSEAAKRADIQSIGVLTGGFNPEELQEAGASAVDESIVQLRHDLDSTPLR